MDLHRLSRSALVAALAVLAAAPDAGAYALDHLRTTDDIGYLKIPNRGTSHILVIPMQVGGPVPANELAQMEIEFASEGGPGSFREFWNVMSNGAYDPIPFLAEPLTYDTCPIEGLGASCVLGPEDYQFLLGGNVERVLVEILERVRDEQDLDLAQFDVNARDCPPGDVCPDGYFDGIILRTSMFGGIAFPFGALGFDLTVPVTPGAPPRFPGVVDGGVVDGGGLDGGGADGGGLDAGALDGGALDAGALDAGGVDSGVLYPTLSTGIVALMPPSNHEFGHTLGFIDLYEGPPVNCLMADKDVGLSAFSRLQIGWGSSTLVDGPGSFVLGSVVEGGTILRFGAGPRYVLVENRGGDRHEATDESPAGLYVYSVDEGKLPTTALGFFDVLGGTLYYPNHDPPYLNISMPFECSVFAGPTTPNACVMNGVGRARDVEHHADGFLGYHLVIEAVDDDGTITVGVREGRRVAPTLDAGAPDGGDGDGDGDGDGNGDGDDGDGCGCAVADEGGRESALALVVVLTLARRRRRAR